MKLFGKLKFLTMKNSRFALKNEQNKETKTGKEITIFFHYNVSS